MTADNYNEKLLDYRKSKIKNYPCNNLRASNIGHVCERYLYLSIVNSNDRQAHDVVLQSIFDLGNAIEEYAINTLKAAGFELITPTQRSWKVENPLITGREDLRIKEEDGQLYPVEVKGLQAQEWEKLNSFEDFKNSKKHYVRAYPSQLLVYMWHFGKEKGYFCLVNKQTGEIKMIEIAFDYGYADAMLKKADRIYAAIAAKKPEDLDTTDEPGMCERCDLRHVCTAKKEGIEADIDDGTIEALIKRKNELKEAADEYEDIKDNIKAAASGREKIIAGNWIITVTKYNRQPHMVKGGMTERLNIKRL